uniref:Protein kinase domain-containing protein n=1 Tax=Rhabditophanes sp. KR3021 TaxID=114890 RepID=A0AC35TVL1_9BILA
MAAYFFEIPDKIGGSSELNFACDGFKHCTKQIITALDEKVVANVGDTVNIKCQVTNATFNTTLGSKANLNYFYWYAFPKNRNKGLESSESHAEIFLPSTNTISLNVFNATSEDLGLVGCLCTWCHHPVYALTQFHINKSLALTARINKNKERLSVEGFPMANLTIYITRLADNKQEMPLFSLSTPSTKTLFNNTLFIKQRSLPTDKTWFYKREFEAFPNECSDCHSDEHEFINKDYLITACRISDGIRECENVTRILGLTDLTPNNNEIAYKGNHTGVGLGISSPWTFINASIFVLVGMGAVLVIVLVIKSMKRVTAVKEKTNQIMKLYSRATSRTEETILNTEETSFFRDNSISLSITSADYTLKHVPIINKDHLRIGAQIGHGNFGQVKKAEWIGPEISIDSENGALLEELSSHKQIAVKTLKDVCVNADWDREIALLSSLDHKHIVKFFGVCQTQNRNNTIIVMEFMNLGDLKSYLKKRAPPIATDYSQFPPTLQVHELNIISKEICEGLCYLTTRQIVHRDLSARNCLVSGPSDILMCNPSQRKPFTVKISDFGMSRKLYSDVEYYKMSDEKGRLLPVRWLSPDCILTGKFSHYSDIWSFGLTCYEVYSFGKDPFQHLSNNEVFSAISMGVRPERPAAAPPQVAQMIANCLKQIPEERITALECLTHLNLL